MYTEYPSVLTCDVLGNNASSYKIVPLISIINSKWLIMYYFYWCIVLFLILLGTTSNDVTASLISDITSTTDVMISIIPTSGISNGIYMLNVQVIRLFIL